MCQHFVFTLEYRKEKFEEHLSIFHIMERRGSAILPLHYGHPPEYLYRRMVKLGGMVSDIIAEKFGVDRLLENFSDPFWFHALSLAIGFDWNSSGTTTATLSAIKEYYASSNKEIFILGGKGKNLSKISLEMDAIVRDGIISDSKAGKIREDARRVAKVDNNLLQDGFDLYMQFLIMDSSGKWVVVQQGMNPEMRVARRYHWLNRTSLDFINDGRNGISTEQVQDKVVDLSTRISSDHRGNMLSIIQDNPKRYFADIRQGNQSTLDNYRTERSTLRLDYKINWDRMRQLYEYQPSDFSELAFMKGIGKSTIRALSYLAELIHGSMPSFKDPVKYSFAVGGKDGVPKPVNVYDYDRVIEFYSEVLRDTQSGRKVLDDFVKKLARESYAKTSY